MFWERLNIFAFTTLYLIKVRANQPTQQNIPALDITRLLAIIGFSANSKPQKEWLLLCKGRVTEHLQKCDFGLKKATQARNRTFVNPRL